MNSFLFFFWQMDRSDFEKPVVATRASMNALGT
jgi:hypothetical protein